MKTERRRDNQQWLLDYMVKTTGRVQNFAYDEREVPVEVKSYRMIPRAMYKVASHYETIAKAAEAKGHLDTAAQLYVKACGVYMGAQHAIYEDDNQEKIFLHRKHQECFDKAAVCAGSKVETVEISWEGVQIQARFHPAPGGKKAPTVLFLPGMDMTKEAFPSPLGSPFAKRGMNVLSIDGPGQGISNIRKIRVSADNYELAAKACIDYLVTRQDVDADKIAVCGASFGTHWGSRLAAIDDRVRAVATAHAVYGSKRAIFEEASPRFKQMFMYMAGIHDEDEFDQLADHMSNEGYGARIKCPSLMITGEFDPLAHMEDNLAFFDEVAGPKEMWVFENEFHRASGREGIAGLEIYHFEADWIKDALEGKMPAGSAIIRVVRQKEGEGPYEEPNRPIYMPGRFED
ncbi:MAG: hypothetical protein JWN15_104 [Firmicutes bacterium]|nr:hypothetical protein [Bacillota bacterium]